MADRCARCHHPNGLRRELGYISLPTVGAITFRQRLDFPKLYGPPHDCKGKEKAIDGMSHKLESYGLVSATPCPRAIVSKFFLLVERFDRRTRT